MLAAPDLLISAHTPGGQHYFNTYGFFLSSSIFDVYLSLAILFIRDSSYLLDILAYFSFLDYSRPTTGLYPASIRRIAGGALTFRLRFAYSVALKQCLTGFVLLAQFCATFAQVD